MNSCWQIDKPYRKVIQLELNEITRPVIDGMISQGKLPTFNSINEEWQYYTTSSEAQYEHLEPWIQWVSAHTGKSFTEHGIFHLGDANNLQHPQIWETLSSAGLQSAIICGMNGVRGKCSEGIFLPDPWNKQERAYPQHFQPLIDLVSTKVQQHATTAISVTDLLQGAWQALKLGLPLSLYVTLAKQLLQQQWDSRYRWKMAAVFDQFLFALFVKIYKKTDFGFYSLFLNSVAHYQHHYWRSFSKDDFSIKRGLSDLHETDDPILYGMLEYDKIINRIINLADKDTLIIIASGLSQQPFTAQDVVGGMFYYRLNNHEALLQYCNITYEKVFPCMSRDWQIEFVDTKSCLHGLQQLQSFTVENKPLFQISRTTDNTLFVETHFSHPTTTDTMIQAQNGSIVGKFSEWFTTIAIKSGHHHGDGSLWVSLPRDKQKTNSRLPLTALYSLPLQALGISLEEH